MENVYDVLIIGGGVAGMSASIYAKRSGKKVAILEKFALGGQVLSLEKIENFPSQTSIDGYSLSQMFVKQVKNLGVEIVADEVKSVDFSKEQKIVFGSKGNYKAKSVVIATGLSSVKLQKNEDEFLGKGVSFCAVCDGNFYKNKDVFVASRKGSGISDAIYLSNIAKSVTILDSDDISTYEKYNKNAKIKILSNVEIDKILGNEKLEKIDTKISGEKRVFDADALFVELGKRPSTEIYKDILKLDERGFIVTDEKMQTSVKGVFAVGDVRNGLLKQIVTACNDGAIAGQLAGN